MVLADLRLKYFVREYMNQTTTLSEHLHNTFLEAEGAIVTVAEIS
jgi:hypothetical protein